MAIKDAPSVSNTVKSQSECAIVGVGASAGGLEAYEQFLTGVSPGQNIAYVFIQHLDPTHESLLGQLLSRRAKIDIVTIEGGEHVKPDTVYLTPPNAQIEIKNGALLLAPFDEPRGRRRPIDYFFASLAADQKKNAACVILSGTGSDGCNGLRMIKAAGGVTLAQEPAHAKYSGMPVSAVSTGLVDLVLPAEKMAPLLSELFRHGELEDKIELHAQHDFLDQVVRTVRYRTGHDFSQYKRSTLLRRIARRMVVCGAKSEHEYLKLLIANPDEAEQLFRDFLINVTNFFRDTDAFQTFKNDIIPKLCDGKGANDTIRVWTPGCSSGEEPYSIAMLIEDYLGNRKSRPKVHIFATDIDKSMLKLARNGVYSANAMDSVPAAYANNYFEPHFEGFQIRQKIREMVHFSEHNLIKDPPFSKVDLISCRNLLIYFNNDLQKLVIPIFHYALVDSGYLFLGAAESLTGMESLFHAIDKTAKIFKKREGKSPTLGMPLQTSEQATHLQPQQHEPSGYSLSEDDVRGRMLTQYVPPHIVVGTDGEILFSSSRTGRFLEFETGKPTLQVKNLAKKALKLPLDQLLKKLRTSDQRRQHCADVVIDKEGNEKIDLYAEKLESGNILIVFNDRSERSGGGPRPDDNETPVALGDNTERIRELEDDLLGARQDLKTTIEELETTNEELKSSNEEMMSMNEELQSANEELTTVNDELQEKIRELAILNSDLANYLASTNIAVIFLDDDFRIREFTPASTEIFRLVEGDKGRAITDIKSSLEIDDIISIVTKAHQDYKEYSLELLDSESKQQYLATASPYIDSDNQVFGVVLAFVDITDIKSQAKELEAANATLERQIREIDELYRTAPQGMALVDEKKSFVKVNQTFADIISVDVDMLIGRNLPSIFPGDKYTINESIEKVFATGESLVNLETELIFSNTPDDRKIVQFDYYPIRRNNKTEAVGLIMRDVTDQRLTETELKRVMRELQHRVKNMLANVLALVRQAERSKRPSDETIAVLSSRITSLANTHKILTQYDWRSTYLSELLESELIEVYGSHQIVTKGPNIELGPRATLSLAMAFHELATNAAKYGALSHQDGTLNLQWGVHDVGDGPQFELVWHEENGPEVKKPSQFGFGTSLISSSIEATLDGAVEMNFEPTGLKCLISAPLARLSDGIDLGEKAI